MAFLCLAFQEGRGPNGKQKGQNGGGPRDMGMHAKPPSLKQWLELWKYTEQERSVGQGTGANPLGKRLPGRQNIVRAKVLRWTVPTFLKSGHTT